LVSSLERGELDVLAGDEVAGGDRGVAEDAVTVVEAVVEEAVGGFFERGRLAAEAVGLDVTAECGLHDRSPSGMGPLPLGVSWA